MKTALQQLLSEGKTDQVIAELRRLTAADQYLHEQLILVAGRQAALERKINIGTARPDDVEVESNKIRAALLDLVKKLPEEAGETKDSAGAAPAANIAQHAQNAVLGSTIEAQTVEIGNKTIQHIGQYVVKGEHKLPRHLTAPPFLSEVFIGREADMRTIHERLFSAGGHLLLLVNGEGGIGKTSLAARYYHDYCDAYQHVAWVLSERSIANAVLLLAAPLGVKFEDTMDTDQRFQYLLGVLANLPKPCLLVVDNANELEDIERYYPQLQRCTNFHILFTTRVNEYPAASFFKIRPLPVDTALQAFREHYKAFEAAEEPVFRELYEAVNGNTLVLELFAKNLQHFNTKLKKRYLLSDLRQDVEKSLLQLRSSEAVSLRYQAKDGVRKARPEEVIAAMYDLSELPDEEQALLSVLAVLPAERMAYELLEQLLAGDETDMDRHLLALAQKGWLDYSDADNSFKISQVVQEVTRQQNAERLLKDTRTLVITLLRGLDSDHRHLDNYRLATLYARLGEAVIMSIPSPDRNLGILCQNIGNYHSDTGNLNAAMQAYQKMSDIRATQCAAEPDNAGFKNGLAISYSKLGDTHSALGELPRALEYYEERNRLGKELHKAFPQNVDYKNGLAISYSKLGDTHRAQGDLPQALEYYEKDIELSKELHEAFPQNVEFKHNLAVSYEKLGVTHRAQGDLPRALEYFEERNRLAKELHESFPQNVEYKNGLAISYEKLGNIHSALGDLPRALEYFEEYNRLGKELYENFPQNVKFKSNFAESLAVLFAIRALSGLSSDTGMIEAGIQFFGELYTQTQRAYYQQKADICKQMKEPGADLSSLISVISSS